MAVIRFESESAYLDYYDAAGRMFDAIWEVADDARGRAIGEMMARVFADNQPESLTFPAAVEVPAGVVAMAREVLGEMLLPGSAGDVAMLSDGGSVTVEE
jgi:hypothetical protein